MVDVSHSGTMFDQKRTFVQSKHVMRPLMRPDEIGSMDETRCIVKIRNQQPILGLRNFYYADKEPAARAWLPINISKRQLPAPDARNPHSGATSVSATQPGLPCIEAKPPIKPGLRFSQLSKPAAKSGVQTGSGNAQFGHPIGKPDFDNMASAINLDKNAENIDIEDIRALLSQGEAGNTIAALIASDIELILSE